jgi:integral membrane sensor domain MASE1
VLAVSRIAFGGGYAVEYMLIPLIIWAGFRFKASGTMLLMVLQVAIALLGTVQGHGSFAPSKTKCWSARLNWQPLTKQTTVWYFTSYTILNKLQIPPGTSVPDGHFA